MKPQRRTVSQREHSARVKYAQLQGLDTFAERRQTERAGVDVDDRMDMLREASIRLACAFDILKQNGRAGLIREDFRNAIADTHAAIDLATEGTPELSIVVEKPKLVLHDRPAALPAKKPKKYNRPKTDPAVLAARANLKRVTALANGACTRCAQRPAVIGVRRDGSGKPSQCQQCHDDAKRKTKT